jgi:hypothetical protein
MNVFLSWSGDKSKALAKALHDYLPVIIQQVKPWFSPEDIEKGSRWLSDLTQQLQNDGVAIICISRESLQSQWMLFEAGALSKAMDSSWVCPVLLDVTPTDLTGPLAQFQSTRISKDDIRRLLGTLNKRLQSTLTDSQIDPLHNALWPDFEKCVNQILSSSVPTPIHRNPSDLLGEILERVRGFERRLDDLQHDQLRMQSFNRSMDAFDSSIPAHNNSSSTVLKDRLEKFILRAAASEKRIKELVAIKHGEALTDDQRELLENKLESERNRLAQFDMEIRRHQLKLKRSLKFGRDLSRDGAP